MTVMHSTRLAALAVVVGGGLLGVSTAGVASLGTSLPVTAQAAPQVEPQDIGDHDFHGHGHDGHREHHGGL
jgi:hypothetical protein